MTLQTFLELQEFCITKIFFKFGDLVYSLQTCPLEKIFTTHEAVMGV